LVHDFVKLLHRLIPSLAVKFVERLVVVAAECRRFLAFESREILAVPEHQVIRKLPDRVILFAVQLACSAVKPFTATLAGTIDSALVWVDRSSASNIA
jgi:hypothetical protein